ncbi:beta-glucuronidase [Paenibacillus agaridevorans]|uniref:beta-galactosidase n=1 Tax=Paenibacillus agaridevorans TaxID=171404 RepID=A0A2R5EVV6_9BACL|nr:beta-glucuronidase [Paenibacillus agaridevorans]GBG10687.1 beta-glucuronidase [Paenibacillus agaridevorans]
MNTKIGLEGQWRLRLDPEKTGNEAEPFDDVMTLPGTTSHAGKGPTNEEALAGSLTDAFKFEGYAWFSREVDITAEQAGWNSMLYLERTRVTTVWIDGEEIGTRNSLCTPHVYELGKLLTEGKHRITIRVDNTSYPTKGGHMTSADTQTNWNGITGRLELQFVGETYLDDVQVYPDAANRTFTIRAKVGGEPQGTLTIAASTIAAGIRIWASETSGAGEIAGPGGDRRAESQAVEGTDGGVHRAEPVTVAVTAGELEVVYTLGDDALLWCDAAPNLYELKLRLVGDGGVLLDERTIVAGLRDFKADGDKFTINGAKTFLRGKHDGLIFPLTGYAPTTLEEWLRILGISKSYGINHYRFHTCCPPDAAFEAADMLGIYMEPELPFWGTMTEKGDEKHNEAEQQYLIQEGFAILRAFGNHPSFVMMSLGNELWGSKSRIAEIMRGFMAYDSRPLYTQGSNNFQFVPVILEEDDFYCGVRFSRDRLFRGSYAMCDAPLGHIQTDKPSTMKDYDEEIIPSGRAGDSGTNGGELQIQYGTEAITVKAEAASELIPSIPVVSHEIGQFGMYPNYAEIEKYKGPLKARNFELFRERLEIKGMGHLADKFFQSSGKLAVECYKEELEAAFRSRQLAGFQLLDLQDFSGQGTALVGVLDAFMDSKGLVEPEEWRTYCSDAVLLARFESYVWVSGDTFRASAELAWFRPEALGAVAVQWELRLGGEVLTEGNLSAADDEGSPYIDLGAFEAALPSLDVARQLELRLWIEGTDVRKSYALWLFPHVDGGSELDGLHLFDELTDQAVSLLEKGENVVLFAKPDALADSIEGTYCTDFWNYPMFRSISESMNKPVPVGTMGLLIDNEHPALQGFPSDTYSTYPWWSIVSCSRSLILDDLPRELSPIVQTIDNVERNYKLGLLFECRALNGKLLVCGAEAGSLAETPEGRQLLRSIADYAKSDAFHPAAEIELTALQRLFSA